jgi:hypothetical protein
MTDMFVDLAAEFPREGVHWRAQSLTQDGTKALALAYLDARDVMDRLDEVCGPQGWSDSYVETAKGRVICSIAIKTPTDGWVSKSDGAGDTDVEGEKGGMSDAFKRAAVKWGIGRYLYRLPSVWAPCESKEWNGKKQWKAWKGSPWDAVRTPTAAPQKDGPKDKELILTLAQTAGVGLATIYESYGKKSIAEMTDAQASAAIKRLQLTIQDKSKEPA